MNRKDAEVTLRELQNKVKEEQLKLAVDQATFKVEFRQFEQAKQNFQEDIEELQSKQSELKQFEDQLNRMKAISISKRIRFLSTRLPKTEASTTHDDEAEQALWRRPQTRRTPEKSQKLERQVESDTWKKPRKAAQNSRAATIGRNTSVDD